MSYEPKTFAKGDKQRIARKPAEEVALKFEGYKEVDAGDESSEATPAATQEHEGTPQYDEGGQLAPGSVQVENTSGQPEAAVGQTYFATGPDDL